MKTLTLILAVTLATFMVNYASANEGDSIRVITKTVKIIDDGKTVVDTTIIYTDEDGNCIINGPRHIMKHHKMTGTNGHTMIWNDDNEQEYEVTVETDGDSTRLITMRKPGNFTKEFRFDGNPVKQHRIMMFNDDDFGPFPDVKALNMHNKNLIDLNDPDIVSFEREETKNGNEKITIIRKKAEEHE